MGGASEEGGLTWELPGTPWMRRNRKQKQPLQLWCHRVCVCRTSLQHLLNLDVVGAEAAVEFEVVGVVEEGAPQREEQLLWTQRGTE